MLDWLRARFADDPSRARACALYAALLDEVRPSFGLAPLQTLPTGRQLAAETPEVRGALLEVACAAIREIAAANGDGYSQYLGTAVITETLRRKIVVPPSRAASLLDICATAGNAYAHWLPTRSLLRFVSAPPSRKEREALERLRGVMQHGQTQETRRIVERIDEILGHAPTGLVPRGPWSARVLADVDAMPSSDREAWRALISHLRAVGNSRPSRKWERELQPLRERVGRAPFVERALEWLALGPLAGDTVTECVPEHDVDYLVGFMWGLASFDDESIPRTLATVAEHCLKKIPNRGPVSARAGNACIRVLGRLPGVEAVAQLGRLRSRVKYAVGRQLIENTLAEAATRANVTLDELEELAVPTFDLDAHGVLTQSLGGDVAQIGITGSETVTVSWTTATGRASKSVPARVRESHGNELASLKKLVKDVAAFLPSQRTRLERLLMAERTIPFGNWRSRYVDHPVVGHMARRLIWSIGHGDEATLAAFHGATLLDVDGRPIGSVSDEAGVRLWHPLGCRPDVVLAWRRWLEGHDVSQPFKQAHREIYLLTDAERVTRVYSNRFAAHIIRQHQFAALCRERNWSYTLQGAWDSGNTPSLPLHSWDLQVQFLAEPPQDGSGVLESGIYQFVVTDQVRFCRHGEPIPLDEVPPLAFSESMRDVDLFVGVCSVGNDPAWGDRGPAPYAAYWQAYAFGALSESATTRRAVLEGVVPRLAIANRLTLEDRFLVVRGDLATYRIHLGSTNVLIEPGSRYLCIVPMPEGKDAGAGVRLPFEGDRGLAIILSKALMLARDRAIADPQITRQIRS